MVVKSINQRGVFDMRWRGRREFITDVRKPEIMVKKAFIVGGALFTDYSDHPRKSCHA